MRKSIFTIILPLMVFFMVWSCDSWRRVPTKTDNASRKIARLDNQIGDIVQVHPSLADTVTEVSLDSVKTGGDEGTINMEGIPVDSIKLKREVINYATTYHKFQKAKNKDTSQLPPEAYSRDEPPPSKTDSLRRALHEIKWGDFIRFKDTTKVKEDSLIKITAHVSEEGSVRLDYFVKEGYEVYEKSRTSVNVKGASDKTGIFEFIGVWIFIAVIGFIIIKIFSVT